jgi:hypothetical protein
VMRGVRSDADEASGVSRVPRNESVRNDTWSRGFLARASRIVDTNSCSVFPMYKVLR